MNIDLIRKRLIELLTITDSWSCESEIETIERDIALDKIKSLYEELRFAEVPNVEKVPSEVPTAPIAEVTPEVEQIEEPQESDEPIIEEQTQEADESMEIISINLDDILIIEEEEIVSEPEPVELKEEKEEEPTQESEASVAPQSVPQSENALFDLNTIPIRPKSRRSAILSLYSDGVVIPKTSISPTEEEQPQEQEPQIEEMEEDTPPSLEIVDELIVEDEEVEEPQEEIEAEPEEQIEPEEDIDIKIITDIQTSTTVIGDMLTPNVETIAERYAAEAEGVTISDTTHTSSLNDRFLIAQDLFGGDMEGCDEMLEKLNSMDNFDDCMIYIVENYDWNPDDEATRLVIKLLEQKFPLN